MNNRDAEKIEDGRWRFELINGVQIVRHLFFFFFILVFFRETYFGGEAEKGFEFVPEITSQDEEAGDKDYIERDIQDHTQVKDCGEELRGVCHYVSGDQGEAEENKSDVVTEAAGVVRLDDADNPVPEYRFDVEVGRLSKDGNTGDLHDGGCKPEYSDNDMLQGMMYYKSL